jgi:dolichol-phosphate mannosyltransferase
MDLTVVVPTRNEAATVDELADRTTRALDETGLSFEILFVDDSDDGTPSAVQRARRRGLPLRLLHRPAAERHDGLAGAVRAGFDDANGSTLLAVIDGDLQHPPEVLPRLVAAVQQGADVAVGSRFVDGGGDVAGLDGRGRRVISRATRESARLTLRRVRPVRDPLSGCFLVRRDVVATAGLQTSGFKILLEILVRGRWSRVAEVPIRMAPREIGHSKAGLREGIRYVLLLARLATTRPGAIPDDDRVFAG